jgi:hypothetical protein
MLLLSIVFAISLSFCVPAACTVSLSISTAPCRLGIAIRIALGCHAGGVWVEGEALVCAAGPIVGTSDLFEQHGVGRKSWTKPVRPC